MNDLLTQEEFESHLIAIHYNFSRNSATVAMREAYATALSEIAALRKAQEWIPVDVEPEFDGTFLCLQRQECGTLQHRLADFLCLKWSIEDVAFYQAKLPPAPQPVTNPQETGVTKEQTT